MFPALSTARSGMQAAGLRLSASASNIANVSSRGPVSGEAGRDGQQVYTPLRTNQREQQGGGTNASLERRTPGTVEIYDPSADYADGRGMVAAPDIDLAAEIVDAAIAGYEFAANAVTFRTASRMIGQLLDTRA